MGLWIVVVEMRAMGEDVVLKIAGCFVAHM